MSCLTRFSAAAVLLLTWGVGCDSGGSEGASSVPDSGDAGDVAADSGQEDEGPPPIVCDPPDEAGGVAVVGRVYVDSDQSDLSVHHGGFDAAEDSALVEAKLHLVGADGTRDATSCEDGRWGVGDLAEGTWLVEPELPEGARCTTRNCAPNFWRAAAEDRPVTVVTIGDSIPVIGDPYMFPSRLADLFAPLITIDNRNRAVGGTVSTDWVPGAYYFESRLRSHIKDMDVLVISVGGNDIMMYAYDFMDDIQNGTFDAEAAVQGAKDLMVEVMEHVVEIVDEVHSINPNVDVVYCLYPNYEQADDTLPWNLVPTFLGQDAMDEIMDTALSLVPKDRNILLADMYGRAVGLDLDDYMSTYQGEPDPLHFNSRGQTLYAEEIFQVLGGVLVGPSPLEYGVTPLGTERVLGLEPGSQPE